MRFPPLNPELLVDAISASGYELTGQIVALGCLENRVFWLPTENQQDLVMKVYRPGRWQQNELDEEHDILLDCEAADLDVVAPIDIEDGFTLGQIENDGVACSFALFPFIRGRCRDELSLESCEYVGGLIADLHLSFERYETSSSLRPKDSVDDYLLWFHGSASPAEEADGSPDPSPPGSPAANDFDTILVVAGARFQPQMQYLVRCHLHDQPLTKFYTTLPSFPFLADMSVGDSRR